MVETKGNKVLLGYTGSWAFGVSSAHEIEDLKKKLKKNPKDTKIKKRIAYLNEKRKGTPVYVTKKLYKAMKEHQKLHEYDWILK